MVADPYMYVYVAVVSWMGDGGVGASRGDIRPTRIILIHAAYLSNIMYMKHLSSSGMMITIRDIPVFHFMRRFGNRKSIENNN